MNDALSFSDKEKVKQLIDIRQCNNDFAWLLVDYMNNTPTLITPELMKTASCNVTLPDEIIYCVLLTALCGLNSEDNTAHFQLEKEYFRQSVKKLDPDVYSQDPYFQNIHFQKGAKMGNWELTYEKYQPYEAFIYADLILDDNFREIPRLGFFDREFEFPAVMENNREWMAIKPNEIETMKQPLDSVAGKVVAFGLGLGYFAYMASLKSQVESVTIVERDSAVIQLFQQFILPQFPYPEKIKIRMADAFDYLEKEMPFERFDFAFVDLWHDVSDGLPLYLKMKRLESLIPQTTFLYWIEDSLLSALRWQLFDEILEHTSSYNEICQRLSKPYLQQMACIQTVY